MEEMHSSTIAPGKLLVTTALEGTWGVDESIVFLGEWCRLYDRRATWEKRQHEVVRNHWDDRQKFKRDYEYLKEVHDSLVTELGQSMNHYHRVDRPRRYWQMILDPWLLTYVAVIWDRWECLRLAFDQHEQLETVATESSAARMAPYDFDDSNVRFLSDEWNHQLFLAMIKFRYSTQCRITTCPIQLSPVTPIVTADSNKPNAPTFRYRIARFLDTLLGRLPVRNRIVLYHSYFPPAALVKLSLSLRQLPRLYLDEFEWPTSLGDSKAADAQDAGRKQISSILKARNAFEAFLFDRVGSDIPWVYLEGRQRLQAKADRVPLSPKVILTANAHWGNDLFKLWSAGQVARGAKLITMEHGGSFHSAFDSMDYEEDISEVKAVWTVPRHPKNVQLPPNKLSGRTFRSNRTTHLGVVAYEMTRYGHRAQAFPVGSQTLTNVDMVCELYSLLAKDVAAHFVVRAFLDRGWNTRQRFIDRLGADKVSNEPQYRRFLASARVLVCTYPQTTFSEAMASGSPTILFYPVCHWETIPEQGSLLETLRAAKIVFHDAHAAAVHLNSIWADPEVWWNSHAVMHARSEFHRQAANSNDDWLRIWTSFIKSVAG